MSIGRTMNTGVSGLLAEANALGIVGDNIANVNTLGFKYSREQFEDVLGCVAGRLSGGGAGVRMLRSQQVFSQGSLVNTGNATDLALTGDGFFVVKGTVDGVTGQFYSRAGQFTLSKDGVLTTPQGLVIQGYTALPTGGFATTLGDVSVSTASLSPNPTTELQVTANLDANALPPVLAWDPNDAANTSNFSTSITVYDSLGNSHAVDVYFRNTGPNTWEYHALADGDEVNPPTPGGVVEWATGTLTYDTEGRLTSNDLTGGGTIDFNGATPGQAIDLEFGDPIALGGTGMLGLTQYGGPSTVSAQNQDGYGSGELTGIQVSADGVVRGVYTNGQTLPVAQIAVAKFRATDGLDRAGHNLWVETGVSGDAVIGAACTGGRASVVAGAVEQSNVDIAEQFVEMIAHQRAFTANSKTITTADEMLVELMNIKR